LVALLFRASGNNLNLPIIAQALWICISNMYSHHHRITCIFLKPDSKIIF
jgi:hypothetical protein